LGIDGLDPSARDHPRTRGSVAGWLSVFVQFTHQSQGKGAEFVIYVLYGIDSYRAAENPADIGFDGYAD